MSFSLSGLASGLDTSQIIQQLMQIERQPVVRLESQKKDLTTEQSIFRSLNTKLKTLKDLAADLTLTSTFSPSKAESTDESIVTATATENAAHGTYEISVTSTAKSHVVQSGEFNPGDAFASSGTITIYHENLATPLDITVSGGTYGAVMEEIKDQINSSNAGVTAAVVETSGGNKSLVLTAENAGQDNKIKFGNAVDGSKVVIEDSSGILSALGISDDDSDGEIDAANVARDYEDAVFSVNGVQVTRSSNKVTDVIEGVTLNLQAAGTANVTVGTDMEELTSKVEAFVEAYNDVVNTIRSNLEKGKSLQGDSTLKSLDSQLYNWVHSIVGGAEAGFETLAQIGITIDDGVTKGSLMTGTMTFDAETFQSKFNENPEAVMDVFMKNDTSADNQDGIARLLNDNLLTWTSAADGLLTLRIQGYDSQISFMDDRIEQMNVRLQMKEEQLQRQFSQMEVALAELQNQQSWLTSQLAQLG